MIEGPDSFAPNFDSPDPVPVGSRNAQHSLPNP